MLQWEYSSIQIEQCMVVMWLWLFYLLFLKKLCLVDSRNMKLNRCGIDRYKILLHTLSPEDIGCLSLPHTLTIYLPLSCIYHTHINKHTLWQAYWYNHSLHHYNYNITFQLRVDWFNIKYLLDLNCNCLSLGALRTGTTHACAMISGRSQYQWCSWPKRPQTLILR